ncbi:putative transcription factor MYB-HB-like family [Helianthus annuus]|nr:putative transcription factor MYB-HB-like family [Helianthus annuus]KAJ0887967.1 putative transcription factor MYB-HB-like family [Helianthus annuus]KAJ0892877.1 putative transcription factor MYB-HB-like family [Helianthus annuus]
MKCKSSVNLIPNHKKGLWSPDEDEKLRDYILNHGLGCWSSVPINAGLQRNGKSCRLRWTNYLRPGLKRGMFTAHEDQIILTLHSTLGNKWSQMSRHLPGRSDNEIKNHWHSYLKKKVVKSDASNEDSSSVSSLKSVTSSPESSPHMDSLSTASKIQPKILFADWISPAIDNSDELSVSGDVDVIYPPWSSQGTTIKEGSRVSNLNLSNKVDMESDLNDLIIEENIYSYLNLNDVNMYNWDDLYSASTTPRQSSSRSL